MFTIIGAMAELESSLISERVKAGMAAAKNRGKKIGRPRTPSYLVNQIEKLAKTTHLSARQKITSQNWRSDLGWIWSMRLGKSTGIAGYFADFVNEYRPKTA